MINNIFFLLLVLLPQTSQAIEFHPLIHEKYSHVTLHNGSIYAARRGEFLVYPMTSGQAEYHETDLDIIDDIVTGIAFDSNGRVWVGTGSRGIALFDNGIWTNLTTDDGLISNAIAALASGPDGDVWAACSRQHDNPGRGLVHIFENDITAYNEIDILDAIGSENNELVIHSLFVDDEEIVLAGTLNNGILRLEDDAWTQYCGPNGPGHIRDIQMLFVDPYGVLWCGGSGGLASYDDDKWTIYCTSEYFTLHPDATRYDAITYTYTDALLNDFVLTGTYHDGAWFFGNYFGGMAMYDGSVWSSEHISTEPENDTIKGLVSDGRSLIVNSDSGIYTIEQIQTNSEPDTPSAFPDITAYPNPFNSRITISYTLTSEARVSVNVYGISGQRLKTIRSGIFAVGTHNCVWDGRDAYGKPVSSGVYFIRLISDHSNHPAVKVMYVQ